MSKKYNIAQIGTFDYENCGDLLFPYVLKKQLEKRIDIDNFILFSPFGGKMPFNEEITVYPVSDMEKLQLEYNFDAIITGGGDLIRFDKNIASKNYNIGSSIFDLWFYPLMIAEKYNIPVIWNSVGVPFEFNDKTAKDIVSDSLSLVDYISVRDNKSKDLLKQCNTKKTIKTVPDSVISISELLDGNQFNSCFENLSERYDFLNNNYVVFQLSTLNSDEDANIIISQLKKVKEHFKCEVVFMPIGYVHNDTEIMTKVYSKASDEFLFIKDKLSPLEMTAILGSSLGYIGTSMHGSILSYSYKKPSIALNFMNIVKLDGFYEQVGRSEFSIKDLNLIFETFCKAVNTPCDNVSEITAKINSHMDLTVETMNTAKEKNPDKFFNLINKLYCIDANQVYSRLYGNAYFEYKNSFDNKNYTELNIENKDGKFIYKFTPKTDVKSIRFDPVENYYCVIKEISATQGNNKLKISCLNGEPFFDLAVFKTTDPQYLIECDKFTDEEITVEAEITLIDRKAIDLFCNDEINLKIEFLKNQNLNLQNQCKELTLLYNGTTEKLNDVSAALSNVTYMYQLVVNSNSWKLTAPLRKVLNFIKRILYSNKFTRNFFKGIKYLFKYGPKTTFKKAKRKLMHENFVEYTLTKRQRRRQEKYKFDKNIKFSVIVPLYNTPEQFLREMIDSVVDQTYKNWELCLADGSDSKHDYVGKICAEYAKKDRRIIYKKLDKNEGISDNTNECIKMSSGDYIALFDHDDLLHPAALFEVMKRICDENADFIYTDENTFSTTPKEAYCPNFKPDFSPDTLRSYNYICHLSVFDRKLLDKVGLFRKECDGSQDYDMILRLTEQAKHVSHIPKIMYYWRAHAASVASDLSAKPYVFDAAKKALSDHLDRIGLNGKVEDSIIPSTYRINYQINGEPLISIIIPTKDHIDDLKKCIDTIMEISTYRNFEIIIVENNSEDELTFKYYSLLENTYPNIKVVTWKGPFNYSAINNFGIKSAQGDYYLLLNNDIKIITPDWLQEMLMYAQRDNVGAVGIKLYYPDDTIQHAGVIVGVGGVAGHSHKYFDRNAYGFMSRLMIAQNLSAVTAACIMIPKHVFEEVEGLDETFKVAFNDVDLCMRIRKSGYLIVFTPYCEAYHYESKSRGIEDTPEKKKRFQSEIDRFQTRWKKELEEGDPYYNPNLTLNSEDFSIKQQ